MNNTATPRYSGRVFWSKADSAYIAVCPEFDGVSAFGNTPEEAMAELGVAVELAVETYEEAGWSLPRPHEEVEQSGQFRLRVPKSLHKWLADAADAEGTSLNSFVVYLLSQARGGTAVSQQVASRLSTTEERLRQVVSTLNASFVLPQGTSHTPTWSSRTTQPRSSELLFVESESVNVRQSRTFD